ncbi:GH1 family beta-glucosidase [Pseudahrensia aquimaris]|uniref:Beta-glucosidase n=1 Tax=Pseudahrensia aquimaris TaxID=744461 RepID=A0ABW3FCJ8_9HYPH
MSGGLGLNRSHFPNGFSFGTATSSYQIEGSSFGGCGVSHWDTFATTPGNTARGENGAIACDHYHRWPQDLDLIRDCGLDAYRFSISWARVQPEGRGAANAEGLDFYDRLVDGMLERGLAPYATLYHWDLPAPLATLGGWQNRDIADRFADYTDIVMRRIGDRMAASATFNEPWCIAWLSHFMGHHAPGLRDIRAAAHAMHHVLLAHGKSVKVMRALGMEDVGVVMNFEYAQAADDKPENLARAKLYDGIYNRWFLGGVFKKEYPADVLDGLGPHMPPGWEKDFDTIAAPVDWLGVNYYTRKLIADDGTGIWPALKEVPGPLEKTSVDWEIYPQGLHHFLTWAHREYAGDIPIHVTENGMASWDVVKDGAVNDEQRMRYLDLHLREVLRAIEDGVPVKSYFIWSLMDNYEWSLGYDKRFGLVHVDFDTLERTPKASWHAVKAMLER